MTSRPQSKSTQHPATQVEWAGETLHLLPAPALWWPQGQTLWVADLHLGKAASYRAAGQPVPGGTTAHNLQRLDLLIHTHRPRHLVCLGDFLHAASARTPQLLDSLAHWRARHPDLHITLVRGNHDSHAGDPPPALQIDVVDEPWPHGPFACCHHPQPHPSLFVLAGHLHPVCQLQGPARDRLRLPCFMAGPTQAVLPAFGAFTGGWLCPPAPGQRLYVVAEGRVWGVPVSAYDRA